MEMTVDRMLGILKEKYGINSKEEFYEAYKAMPEFDIGMWTQPIRKEARADGKNAQGD